MRARQGKLGGDIHAVEAAFAAVGAGRMLAGGEGGEILEVAFDSDVCASDGGPQSAEKSAHLRIRHAPQARSEREGERERAKGRGGDAPLYCCLVDLGWEGAWRDRRG